MKLTARMQPRARAMTGGSPHKTEAYENLCDLNLGFEQALQNLNRLEKAGMLHRRFARSCAGRTEQLRAEINRMLTAQLQELEHRDYLRHGRRARIALPQE